MDIESRSIKLVSTGKGVTTCSFFKYPNDNGIIYSSTHMDNPDCPSKPDFSKGYIWKLYPGFDIYEADLSGSNPRPLTSSPGYDAEATVSPKGDKIVFTSNRSGDLELYTMNIDGTEVTQITNELGYDGGAFFSPDGTKIVFRSSRPKTKEEIEVMKESCQLAAEVLIMIEPYVKPGVTTERLNQICHDYIVAKGAIPSPLNYRGFPKSICTSVNEEICHGIPCLLYTSPSQRD